MSTEHNILHDNYTESKKALIIESKHVSPLCHIDIEVKSRSLHRTCNSCLFT